ncbi:MAG: glyoxalase/bleomycin resistance/dioxygenase family protein [Vitreoscilla sp.]|nr:glyoxalase/bleomycin resistance/dioxygenase family protein [Burkholderiales bacterium]MBP6338887.1 glyoxalase/bleomycin resistance/dioxygenase family protein [Vitreoscilla sp.]MBP6675486.1 glyoxalase/bleomycin resistance/dioxygenase family protein [Vitreoscilla sp.]
MKRFHVHLHVADLATSIGFYSKLFAAEPARLESDYAKWMLEDPPVNFAISTRGKSTGIDHLGIQVDNANDLAEMKARAQAADMLTLDEGTTTCCYAKSEKHWVTDPQGVAWEQFHTLANIPVFREGEAEAGACCTPTAATVVAEAAGCCTPAPRGKAVGIPVKTAGGCC